MVDAATFAPDGAARCPWSAHAPEFLAYHDTEWGFPVADDTRLFEKLCLESFQSGLSWRTILVKREAFRSAFSGFDIAAVAAFGSSDVERLLADAQIVRNRSKIEAAINNARRAADLIDSEGSLAAYLWAYEPAETEVAEPQTETTSSASTALAKDLKKRGWKFVGPTTAFAFMQSMGLINDHVYQCVQREAVEQARDEFSRPGTLPR